MKIKVVSDLHLEFADINIKNDEGADVLILSGDICLAQDLHDHPQYIHSAEQMAIANSMGMSHRQKAAQTFRDFFKRCSFQFKDVIYVMGNHEHYHGKFDKSAEYIREAFEQCGITNIHLLDRDTKTIDDVTFIGGTLWTDMNNMDALTLYHIEQMMNDFKVIRIASEGYRKFLPKRAASEHVRTKQYFRTVLEGKTDQKFVVVGHHAPSFMSISEAYQGDQLMNGGYASDLSEFILDHPQIKLWTHGHMHQNFDYMIGDTRVVCNPRGYNDENPLFNPNMILEI
jgi:Icc-related predicted phosphoesterase